MTKKLKITEEKALMSSSDIEEQLATIPEIKEMLDYLEQRVTGKFDSNSMALKLTSLTARTLHKSTASNVCGVVTVYMESLKEAVADMKAIEKRMDDS